MLLFCSKEKQKFAACNFINFLRLKQYNIIVKIYKNNEQKKFYFFLFFLNFLVAHLYPFIVFFINLLALVMFHLRKNYQIRNYLGFFLFIFWPCCFYIYLYCFVSAVVDQGILLETYESPYFVRINFESLNFWLLRFSAISTIPCPVLGFELNPVYFRQFLFETYYGLTVICEIIGLSFSFKVWCN